MLKFNEFLLHLFIRWNNENTHEEYETRILIGLNLPLTWYTPLYSCVLPITWTWIKTHNIYYQVKMSCRWVWDLYIPKPPSLISNSILLKYIMSSCWMKLYKHLIRNCRCFFFYLFILFVRGLYLALNLHAFCFWFTNWNIHFFFSLSFFRSLSLCQHNLFQIIYLACVECMKCLQCFCL